MKSIDIYSLKFLLFRYRSFLILIFFLTTSGCANRAFEYPCNKYCVTGEWIFSEEWYSCYKRGVSCTRGGCWEYAKDEFLRAIQQKRKDGRWVMTFGMHRLPEYFPNRELGITFYHLGDIENALKYLSTSYEQCTSSKTIYYLNKIRKEKLIQSKQDKEPPHLYIGEYDFAINKPIIMLSVSATDDTFVAKIKIEVNNEEPLSLMKLSMPSFRKKQKIYLRQGLNEVLVKAHDLLGKENIKRIKILVDQDGPLIYFAKTKKDDYISSLDIQGIIYDPSDVMDFSLNGQEVALTRIEIPEDPNMEVSNQAYYFRYTLSLEDKDKDFIQYRVKDSLNNITSGKIRIRERFKEEKIHAYNPDHKYIQIAMVPQLAITDIKMSSPFCQIAKKTSPNPVQINITQFPKETFEKEISPQIEILSNSQVRQVYINNEPILSLYGIKWDKIFSSYLRKYLNGEQIGSLVFPRIVELKKGENIINVKVEDEFGVTWEKDIMVIRRERQIDQIDERWRMVVPYIICDQGEKIEKKKKLTNKLIGAFIKQERFYVLDLQNLPIIINEKRLIRYLESPYLGLSKKSKIWIDVVLLGFVQETDDSFTLIGSLVDLETGEILATIDVFEKIDPIDPSEVIWEDNLWEHIYNNCYVLAARFKEYFPLCEGNIIDIQLCEGNIIDITKGEIVTSICKNDGLKKGMKLIIYEKSPEDEEYIILNEAKVREVNKECSIAKLIEKVAILNINNVKFNYALITR